MTNTCDRRGVKRMLLAAILNAAREDPDWLQSEGIPALADAGYIGLEDGAEAVKKVQARAKLLARTRKGDGPKKWVGKRRISTIERELAE